MAALLALAACNPVETLRDWTGTSRNDPDPETTPNSKNLAAGETSDYPNLATVPPPPSRAMTAADREKLSQSLIADRTNARYSDEQLRAGFSVAGPTPPSPPLPAPANEATGTQPEPAASAAPPGPKIAAPLVPPTAKSVPSIASPTPLTPAPLAAASKSGTSAGEKSVTLSSAAPTAQASSSASTTTPRALRKEGEPPEPGPMESTLETPQARATPQPEQIQPPPPSPQLPPAVATTAKPVKGGLAAGGVLAPAPLPQATATAGFEPAPAPPQLPPPAPVQSAESTAVKGGSKPSPALAGKPVAEVKFTADSTNLGEGDRQTLETVVPLYQQNPGKVRVVGYAPAGGAAVEKLNSYRTALERAQAVAAALSKAGIPSDKIEVEAAPTGPDSGESRAEVLLEH